MAELKPCPFCGGNAKISWRDMRFLGQNYFGAKKIKFASYGMCEIRTKTFKIFLPGLLRHGTGGLTMADYIRRDYALHNIECGPWDTETDRNRAIHYMRELTPAANVRPVVKASWKKDNSYPGPGLMNLRCSVCGGFGGTWKDNTLPSMLYKFCPNCGAEMERNLDTTKGDNHD